MRDASSYTVGLESSIGYEVEEKLVCHAECTPSLAGTADPVKRRIGEALLGSGAGGLRPRYSQPR